MPPLRLGRVPSGVGTADLFVTIEDDNGPILVPIYTRTNRLSSKKAQSSGARGDLLVLETRSDVIDPETHVGSTISLDSYFADFYWAKEYLLVATGRSLMRFSSVGDLLWKASGLGLDGVYVTNVDGSVIKGEGE